MSFFDQKVLQSYETLPAYDRERADVPVGDVIASVQNFKPGISGLFGVQSAFRDVKWSRKADS